MRERIDSWLGGEEAEAGLPRLVQLLGAVRFTRAADSTLRFVDVEGPCSERMGLSRSTLTGDAYSYWSRVDSRDRRRVLGVLEEAIRKGSTYSIVYRLEGSDGLERSVREEGVPVRGEDGEVEFLEGLILDGAIEPVSLQGDGAGADLAESNERFRKLVDFSAVMTAEISGGPRISFASEQLGRELGTRAYDLQDRDPLSLIHPEDLDSVVATAHEAVRSGAEAGVLCRLRRADGSWLWAELSGRVYTTAQGLQRGVIAARNVENRVQLEEAFLAQRLAEARIGRLSRRFIELGSERLDEVIVEAIEAAAEIGGADRSYLAAFPVDRVSEPRTWVWQREGLDDWQLEIHSRDPDDHAWMREKLVRGEVIRIPQVAEMPDAYRSARERLLERGIASYCVIPVRFDGHVAALLGFQVIGEARDWTEQQLALLRLVAELLASVLQRRDIEAALRDGEQRLQVLADSAQDGICENDIATGSILYANPRFYEMHGYTAENAQGMSSYDLMHPEGLEKSREAHEAFDRGLLGESLRGTLLYRGLHRDGRTLWLEANGHLYRTASGEARSAAVIRDVTEREQAQRLMERRLENQRRISNMARDLLALGLDEMDAGIDDGLASLLPISQADRAWLVTYDPETGEREDWEWRDDGVAPAGLPLQEVHLDDHRHAVPLFQAGRELAMTAGSDLPADSAEMRFLAKRGVKAILAIPLLSGSQVIGVVAFERVESELGWEQEAIALLRLAGEVFVSAVSRKRAEQALRESRGQLLQAQKMEAVGTLAGGVAHDFNNQLSVILGNARYVGGEVAADEELHEAMNDLERAADYCAQLTRQLLSFSRHAPAERRSTSVSKVLRDVAELTAPLLSRTIDFEAHPHDEFASVWADRTQLQQVLVNLVVNAKDAMPDGGSLTIRTRAREVSESEAERLGLPVAGDYVQFTVADTGFGMDTATQTRIFEPFFTTKEQGKGTGLGLATVYGILSESGGTIWADSEVGVGTTFRLLLPCDVSDEEDEAPSGPGLEGGETLLLVEDEPSVRRLMRRMLEHIGFHVLEASGGDEALRLAASRPGDIDVLVSDVCMPGMGGVELGRLLLEARPTLRVLLVTGRAEDDVSLPGARILCKPFRREELAWALEALLRA